MEAKQRLAASAAARDFTWLGQFFERMANGEDIGTVEFEKAQQVLQHARSWIGVMGLAEKVVAAQLLVKEGSA